MNPKAITFVLFASVLAPCLAISPPLRAQVAGATLTGAITDAQGGVIANARVSAKNVATGLSTDTTTNTSGAYSIANLIPANYDVSVSAAGFSTAATATPRRSPARNCADVTRASISDIGLRHVAGRAGHHQSTAKVTGSRGAVGCSEAAPGSASVTTTACRRS